MISPKVALGGKQQIASAASSTHDLLIVALTNCSLKFFLASEIAWSHCSNLTVSFSHSIPEKHGMSGILLRNVVSDVPNTAGPPA